MKRNFKIFLFFLLATTFLLTSFSFAEEKKGAVKSIWEKASGIFKKPSKESKAQPKFPSETKKSPMEELTNEQIIERIEYMLVVFPEIYDFIPELKDEDLKELNKARLIKLHNRVANERTRLQTQRIQRQLETVRASQNVPRQPPRIYAPPTVPKPPTPPPSPPRVHTPPPTPPSAPRR